MSLLRFAGGPRLPVVLQSEAAECGLACLAMVAGFHGHELDLNALRRRFAVSIKGITLKTLLLMAQRLGMTGRGVRLEPEGLAGLRTPAVLHWDMDHFVVLKEVRGSRVTLHDPAIGVRRCDRAELGRHFTGIALELAPTAGFERKNEVRRLRLGELCGRIAGLWRAMAQALVLSIVLQVFVLASPFYMQLAVDEGVLQGDKGLLTALAVGFGLLTLIKLAADWLRALVLNVLGSVVNFQCVVNLFHHFLRLPITWFERRHIGDVVSRFGATRPITDLIAEGLVATIVDGLMAVLTLAMIIVYSPTLAAVVVGGLVLLVAVRLASFRALRLREEETIHALAKEQTSFIETARAIQSIKLFGRESDRESLWQTRYADTVNRKAGLTRMQATLRIINDLIQGAGNILVIYLGARLAIAGDMTVGMLFAFMSYRQQFIDKTTSLIETGIKFRMLDLHLGRIADIALADREAGLDHEPLVSHSVTGQIELRDISFRYADTEPEVVSGASLTIEPGEFVAITGASGGGKTTLLKIMLGLLRPASGEVLIDGVQVDRVGVGIFRAQIGVVMQEDHLLTGSIAENITFFDPQIDVAWLRQCAAIAGIDAEIMAMPMNYNTLVGDLGTGLSGGQRQRLLLARALYRRPRILFMDEGTSHLDLAKEREVNAALRELQITRVIIAHRPETIAAADRVLRLEGGRVLDDDAAARPLLSAAA
jgi:ATP-binding cassette subfamily B protein RaxB